MNKYQISRYVICLLSLACAPTFSSEPRVFLLDDDYCAPSAMIQIEYSDVYKNSKLSFVMIRIGDVDDIMFESVLSRSGSVGTYFCIDNNLIKQVTIEIGYGSTFCTGAKHYLVGSLENLDQGTDIQLKDKNHDNETGCQ